MVMPTPTAGPLMAAMTGLRESKIRSTTVPRHHGERSARRVGWFRQRCLRRPGDRPRRRSPYLIR